MTKQATERAQFAREARIETGKENLARAQQALVHRTERLSESASASRLECGRTLVWKLRRWFGGSIEIAKVQLRLAQMALVAYTGGLDAEAASQWMAAEGSVVTPETVTKLWVFPLGLQSARTGDAPTGKHATKAAVLEVRP